MIVKSRVWRTAIVCLGLIAITWIVFGQTLGHEFVNFDDDKYVYDNVQISGGLHWQSVLSAFTHSHAALWHPLTSISHMIDCQLYGLRPGGHHFTNVFLHSIAVILLFLVLSDMTGRDPTVAGIDDAGRDQRSRLQGQDTLWPSAFVAALFAIHPMRVESVAWIAERKDVLSAVFLMLTLGAYARFARKPTLARYAIVALFVACGLMSKATFVTVPFVLLLLDYWPLHRLTNARDWKRAVLEKIPLVGLSVAASTATFFAQTVTMSSLGQLPLLPRIKNAIVSIVIYIRQMFWPRDLAVFYPHPHDRLSAWVVAGAGLTIVALTTAAVLVRRKRPYVLVGWLWYLGMLAPVLGIVQVGLQGHADRFTYLPHIGLFIAISWTIADLTRGWRYREPVLRTSAAGVLALLTICSMQQTSYWKNSISLWTHTLEVTSDNTTAHMDLAVALWEQGRFQESKAHTQSANLIHWQTVLKDFPFDPRAHDELGVALVQRGEIRQAIAHWQTSLQVDPTDGNAANNLAWVLATSSENDIRDGHKAVELAERAAHSPGGENAMLLRTLAAAYAESGRFAEAIATASRAADIATAQKNPALAETLRDEIKSYTANQPHHEPAPQ